MLRLVIANPPIRAQALAILIIIIMQAAPRDQLIQLFVIKARQKGRNTVKAVAVSVIIPRIAICLGTPSIVTSGLVQRAAFNVDPVFNPIVVGYAAEMAHFVLEVSVELLVFFLELLKDRVELGLLFWGPRASGPEIVLLADLALERAAGPFGGVLVLVALGAVQLAVAVFKAFLQLFVKGRGEAEIAAADVFVAVVPPREGLRAVVGNWSGLGKGRG